MRAVINLTGRQFGRWIVLKRIGSKWKARCQCGTVKLVDGYTLRNGTSTSCGCRHFEQGEQHVTHGENRRGQRTSEYDIWAGMRRRCNNPKDLSYSIYGGRGIRVCKRWKSFANFLVDMGRRPSRLHTLDRKNNDGPYSPTNCRWATKTEQNRNRSNSRLITLNGVTKSLAAWIEIVGITHGGFYNRIKRGWSAEDALTKPRKRVLKRG